ncbi:MAG: thiamine ABC transporter substrate-binding protein [Scrofimicrobium sp.]
MKNRPSRRPAVSAFAAVATIGLMAGCSVVGTEKPSGDSITLVTHDSFAMSEEVMQAFTDETGISVTQVAPGDGGALVNQLVLTKDSPLGDVVYGVSDSFASRGVDEGVFAPYASPNLPASAESYLVGDLLTPIDASDVCMNVDLAWFADRGVTPPATLEDLTKPEYANQTVLMNPATSSVGLSFLVTTIAAFGDEGWPSYWEKLRENGVSVVDGWSDAYYVDFTAAGEGGDHPIVLSYSSSPPYTIGDDGEATTAALLETCSRQIEYAGVIEGATNPEGAQKFIDFMLSEQFQAQLPEQMFVYPINTEVALPEDWEKFAPRPTDPFYLSPEQIDSGRSEWIEQWTSLMID